MSDESDAGATDDEPADSTPSDPPSDPDPDDADTNTDSGASDDAGTNDGTEPDRAEESDDVDAGGSDGDADEKADPAATGGTPDGVGGDTADDGGEGNSTDPTTNGAEDDSGGPQRDDAESDQDDPDSGADAGSDDGSGGLTGVDSNTDESDDGDSGGLTKVDSGSDRPDEDDGDTGGLTKVDSDSGDSDDDSGGLTKVDSDSGGSDDEDAGGLRKVDPDSGPREGPRRPDETGPHAEEQAPITRSTEPDTPPPGHAAGAPSPEDVAEGRYDPETDDGGGADAELAEPDTGTSPPTTGDEPGDYSMAEPITSEEELAQPPDDEEMPLAAHVEEMVKRLFVVVAAIALATAVAFPFATDVLNTMWDAILPPGSPEPHLYGPLEKLLSELKVASLAGLLVALPVVVYESYLFMRPGLYPRERRYYLAAVPTSLVLGAIGMAFAYFLVLPILFEYFIFYSQSGVDKLAFGLRVTFDLIVALLGAFALIFQIPLLIMLAIMMGVTSRRWLESRRLYFWGGFLGVGFLMGGADLTGMAPIIIAATMIALFEGTLALLRWTGSG